MKNNRAALGFWVGIGVMGMTAGVGVQGATTFGAFRNNATQSSAAVAAAIANVPITVGTVYDANGLSNDIAIYNFGTFVYQGAVDVSSTLARIRAGDCMTAESNDGGFFNLTSGELPNIPRKGTNYYMEFVVWPSMNLVAKTYDQSVQPYPGVAFPGPMRLLIGLGGEVYFTGDHYGDGPQVNAYLVNPAPAGAPEAGTLGLLGIGTAGLVRRRRAS